jgi:hypothetical protein
MLKNILANHDAKIERLQAPTPPPQSPVSITARSIFEDKQPQRSTLQKLCGDIERALDQLRKVNEDHETRLEHFLIEADDDEEPVAFVAKSLDQRLLTICSRIHQEIKDKRNLTDRLDA